MHGNPSPERTMSPGGRIARLALGSVLLLMLLATMTGGCARQSGGERFEETVLPPPPAGTEDAVHDIDAEGVPRFVARDADPLTCNPDGTFTGPGNLPNRVDLR